MSKRHQDERSVSNATAQISSRAPKWTNRARKWIFKAEDEQRWNFPSSQVMTELMKGGQEIKLAENLKRLISERNETVTSTAKKVKIHKSSLHNYCNGVIPRNLIALKDLADFFGNSLSELVFGKKAESFSITPKLDFEGRFEIVIRRIDD